MLLALLMGFQKWAHFPLNSQRLPRYESPKIFSTFYIILWNRFHFRKQNGRKNFFDPGTSPPLSPLNTRMCCTLYYLIDHGKENQKVLLKRLRPLAGLPLFLKTVVHVQLYLTSGICIYPALFPENRYPFPAYNRWRRYIKTSCTFFRYRSYYQLPVLNY